MNCYNNMLLEQNCLLFSNACIYSYVILCHNILYRYITRVRTYATALNHYQVLWNLNSASFRFQASIRCRHADIPESAYILCLCTAKNILIPTEFSPTSSHGLLPCKPWLSQCVLQGPQNIPTWHTQNRSWPTSNPSCPESKQACCWQIAISSNMHGKCLLLRLCLGKCNTPLLCCWADLIEMIPNLMINN